MTAGLFTLLIYFLLASSTDSLKNPSMNVVSTSKSPCASPSFSDLIKPERLVSGDSVGLISPASPIAYSVSNISNYLQGIQSTMSNFGLKTFFAPHMLDQYGFLAGKDEDRASDINQLFSNRSIKFILANRGGWGCDRILPLLDYELIAKNPKIIMGYSDLTSLLHAIHFQTGLVTFYGPMGIDNWQNYNGKYFSQVVMEGKKVLFRNPNSSSLNITTITGGKAKGKLYGGNLSVFNTLIGTPFLPNTIDWTKVILFLEDTNEEPYRIDRMIVTLKLAGILDSIAGFVWGICNSCNAANPSQSFTLQEVIESHVKPLGIPAFSGSMIGHISEQFTLPIGIEVELDADQGTILMLETSVLG